ncbi:T9SS type A sorting domain-containing protein [Winogradskyella endarachnes]|uniref:T9SS type A sorting domain-containing protein n=1 Tax=Winogradskyella endarachnes TaxID=2681965 RepID=A0A6L6UBX3_9FLAO|nr:T9SS type A sorting domain-containing protein [Winogradskyella endarachnes]MUU79800.1 T9SS type A sorting domain-containing protein [Winogradskyella endarachnes]
MDLKKIKFKHTITIIFTVYLLASYGQNQNLSNGVIFDGEPYLSINPFNSQHIVVAWMGWVNLSNKFKIKIKSSFDGGETWSTTSELPHTVSGYTSADPSIDFNQNGEVFVCYIDFTGTEAPVTGGVYVSKSTDGGLTWNTPTEVINTNYDGTKWPIDRPWMVIDKSASVNSGNIYVTTMNLNRDNPSFNPYLSISNDSGNSFTTTYIDAVGWLAGSINPLPMCSPAVSSNGIFYGVYPSFVLTQSLYAQAFLATSIDAGSTFTYNTTITHTTPTNIGNYSYAKKASLLLCNPSNASHLAYIYLSAELGDLDVFLIESLNAGVNWTTPTRINDDPIGNNRMQDLIWGDFDSDGDLVISWRDRRNGTDGTFQNPSEIWASYRSHTATEFSPNFQITNQLVSFDTDLEHAGNDFMSIKTQDDILYAAWGDPRDGELNIWFQRLATDGTVLSINQISSEKIPDIFIYPNPTMSKISIESDALKKVIIYDLSGKVLLTKTNNNNINVIEINTETYPSGTYIIEVTTSETTYTKKVVKH